MQADEQALVVFSIRSQHLITMPGHTRAEGDNETAPTSLVTPDDDGRRCIWGSDVSDLVVALLIIDHD